MPLRQSLSPDLDGHYLLAWTRTHDPSADCHCRRKGVFEGSRSNGA